MSQPESTNFLPDLTLPHPSAKSPADAAASEAAASAPDDPAGLKERLAALAARFGDGGWIPRSAARSALLLAVVALVVWQGGRFLSTSFRAVPPGEAGIGVNKFTGSTRAVPPGTHFLPTALYDLHTFRVSDRLLADRAGRFVLSTKEGVAVGVAVQARWALDADRLLARWAALPANPEGELVAPVLASSFRSVAPAFLVTELIAEKREEVAKRAADDARKKLAEAGVVLKDVVIADLSLPAEYENARRALLQATHDAERKEATLRLKEKEVLESKLVAEAEKVRREKQAETEASQRLIAAKAESEAMQYILPLKEKAIEQKKLEAEADRATRIKRAEAEAEADKIKIAADAERRRTMADAEAYAIRTTSLAQFENLRREAELIQANPAYVSKVFAEKISDKVQVILTPKLSSDLYSDEVMKRIANGKPVVTPARAELASSGTKSEPEGSN